MKKLISKNDSSKNVFSTREMILVSVTALIIGISIGILLNKTKIINKSPFLEDKYLNEFASNYQYIIDNYYEKVDKEKLINGAISGMTDSLGDPFSMYIDDETSNTFSITLNGSYNGLGIQILEDKDNQIIIAAVFKNSPAERAGIKTGDKLISVNEIKCDKMSAAEVASQIRNNTKENIKLEIEHEGETKNITIKKNKVELSSVTSKIYTIDNKKVGYIYLSIFANNTYSQFKKELDNLEKEKIDYLIIDVRQNSGGHLTSIDSILDLFLNNKQIMYQFNEKGKITKTYGRGNDNKKYEIVLLGDENSASASEVLIASLKENLNAKFIGIKTYGKGTVQELKTLFDGNQYKITTKKWLTPKGNWINDTKGIVPDIEIKLDEKYYETYDETDDTQLQRTFEYIRTGN